MRNKNIFIRKDTAHYCERSNWPVFALVTQYVDGNVYYLVDYPEPASKDARGFRWHYGDNQQLSGTYIKPLEDFLALFAPDYMDHYGAYLTYN